MHHPDLRANERLRLLLLDDGCVVVARDVQVVADLDAPAVRRVGKVAEDVAVAAAPARRLLDAVGREVGRPEREACSGEGCGRWGLKTR